MKKYHSFGYLRKALKSAGLPFSKKTLLLRERNGLLKLRRDPVTDRRMITDKDIKEIIKAFSPEGKGFWKYK